MSIVSPQALGANPMISVQAEPYGEDHKVLEANAYTLPAFYYIVQNPQFWGQMSNLLLGGIAQEGGVFGHLMTQQFKDNPYYKGLYFRSGAAPVVTISSPNITTQVPIQNKYASNLTIKTITTVGGGAGQPVTGVVIDTAIGSTTPQLNRVYRAVTNAGVTQEFFISAITNINQGSNTVTVTITPIYAATTLGVFAAGSKFWQIGEVWGTTTRPTSSVSSKQTTIFQQNRVGATFFQYEWESANTMQKLYWGIEASQAALANPFVQRLGIPTAGKYQLSWTADFLNYVVNYMISVEKQLVWSLAVDDAQSQYMGLYTNEAILTTNGVVPTIEELGFALTYNPAAMTLYDYTSFQQQLRRKDFSMITDYVMYDGDNYDLNFQQFTQNYKLTVNVNVLSPTGSGNESMEGSTLSWGINRIAITHGLKFYAQCYGQFTSTVNGTNGTSAAYTDNCMFIPHSYTKEAKIDNVTYQTPSIVLLSQNTYQPQWSTVTAGMPSPNLGLTPFMMDMDVTSTAPAAKAIGIAPGAYTVAKDNISMIKGEQRLGVFLNNAFACAMMKPA